MFFGGSLIIPTTVEARLGCGKKEFRCRWKSRQPEPLMAHQSPVSAELNAAGTASNDSI